MKRVGTVRWRVTRRANLAWLSLLPVVLLLGGNCGGKTSQGGAGTAGNTAGGTGGGGAPGTGGGGGQAGDQGRGGMSGGASGTAGTIGAGGTISTGGAGGGGGTGGAGRGGTSGGGAGGGGGGGAGGGSAGGRGGGAGSAACPSLAGPSMVSVGGFCIDSTEVTQAQYRAWLATSPSTAGQGLECGWNTSFLPPDSCTVNSTVCPWETGRCNDSAQVCVDWCDAQAFCRAAGKRLCGSPSGGPASYDDWSMGQWRTACGGVYPYGDQYVGGVCMDSGNGPIGAGEVASHTGCVVLHDGHPVFDMSGNATEWEDACSTNTGAADICRVRGGGFLDPPAKVACESMPTEARRRNSTLSSVGIRCCSQ